MSSISPSREVLIRNSPCRSSNSRHFIPYNIGGLVVTLGPEAESLCCLALLQLVTNFALALNSMFHLFNLAPGRTRSHMAVDFSNQRRVAARIALLGDLHDRMAAVVDEIDAPTDLCCWDRDFVAEYFDGGGQRRSLGWFGFGCLCVGLWLRFLLSWLSCSWLGLRWKVFQLSVILAGEREHRSLGRDCGRFHPKDRRCWSREASQVSGLVARGSKRRTCWMTLSLRLVPFSIMGRFL